MRVPACFVLVLSLMAVPDLYADPERTPVTALIAELSSKDADARRAAADRIVNERGYLEIERVARHASALGDASWQTFADAVVKKKVKTPSPACAIVAAAHVAPEAHRRRLLKLAIRLNPEAGRTPTPQEIEALVRHELVELHNLRDRDFFGQSVAIYGHVGMAPALKLLHESDTDIVDHVRGSGLLETMAQPEDIPILRKLLLAGKWYVAGALERLDWLGHTKASDALIDVVRTKGLDSRIARYLGGTSQRGKVLRAVHEWMKQRGSGLTNDDRSILAGLFMKLDSRNDIPLLEAWCSSTRDPANHAWWGKALVELGSAKGIEILVQVMEAKKIEPSISPAPKVADRLRAKDSNKWRRWSAMRTLNAVRVQLSDSANKEGPWNNLTFSELYKVTPSVRAWWEKTKDKIYFDKKAGEWRLKPKPD